MLGFLPPVLNGIISFLLYLFSTVIVFILLTPFTLLKFVVKNHQAQIFIALCIIWVADLFIRINNFNLWLTKKIHWDVQGLENLSSQNRYLVISNHCSWVDILVLQKIFIDRIPFLKFFLKQELIWVPFLGIGWWALDFPFMKRYSPEVLKKHPELRGKDVETTKKACEKFRHTPVSVINFVEGTRFTQVKHFQQQSPYQHLLQPKAGGVAYTINTIGEIFTCILDVTIVYPDQQIYFWDFLCGKVQRIIVRVEQLPIPEQFIDRSYNEDEQFRLEFKSWLNKIWADKDARIQALLS